MVFCGKSMRCRREAVTHGIVIVLKRRRLTQINLADAMRLQL